MFMYCTGSVNTPLSTAAKVKSAKCNKDAGIKNLTHYVRYGDKVNMKFFGNICAELLQKCISSIKYSEHADGGEQFQLLLKRVSD